MEWYDFFQPSIGLRLIKKLSTLVFAARKENIMLLEPTGSGKTNTSVGISLSRVALRGCITAYYTTLPKLIADMKKIIVADKTKRKFIICLSPNILVIDEVGCMHVNLDAVTPDDKPQYPPVIHETKDRTCPVVDRFYYMKN